MTPFTLAMLSPELRSRFPFPYPTPKRSARSQAKRAKHMLFWSSQPCMKPGHSVHLGDEHFSLRLTSSSACYCCQKDRNANRDAHLRFIARKTASETAKAANPDLWDKYPQTPASAREKSLAFYFTGKPCPKGHIALRYCNNSKCTACAGRVAPPPSLE